MSLSGASFVESHISWQRVLFSEDLNRLDLLKLAPDWDCESISVRVHRNHNFETLVGPANAFLAYAQLCPSWTIGEYDDSLSFNVNEGADVEIVWIDFFRYQKSLGPDELFDWFQDRLQTLRQNSSAPIIAANWAGSSPAAERFNSRLNEETSAAVGIVVSDQETIRSRVGDGYWDCARSHLTGTRLSDRACLESAKHIGSQLIPGLLRPGIKAVAVDLDNTLYRGVLAEDGIRGVTLTAGHRRLQEQLTTLQSKGLLLVCLSRNEPVDVERLFAERPDFPLKATHFSDWRVGWNSKAQGLRGAAQKLGISVDAFLFLDDNTGELATMAAELPQVRSLYSGSARETTCALRYYPCLTPQRVSSTDTVRASDLKANEERQSLANQVSDPSEYLRALGVSLTFYMSPREQLQRLHEMSRKTNQFNLNGKRWIEGAWRRHLNQPDSFLMLVSYQDKYGPLGKIAVL
ncbi:MAG: HAD-IIIC family phosphatase, partial [Acidobacteria bacterium]|nr:HAD-IIIC family phosphatase [Acidobacteriota bacterium]